MMEVHDDEEAGVNEAKEKLRKVKACQEERVENKENERGKYIICTRF